MGYRFCANSGEMMGVCGVFSGNGNTLPERGYSPSILEGELGPLRQGVPELKTISYESISIHLP